MSGPAKRGQETLSGSEADPAAAQFSWRFEAQLRCQAVVRTPEFDLVGRAPRDQLTPRSKGPLYTQLCVSSQENLLGPQPRRTCGSIRVGDKNHGARVEQVVNVDHRLGAQASGAERSNQPHVELLHAVQIFLSRRYERQGDKCA